MGPRLWVCGCGSDGQKTPSALPLQASSSIGDMIPSLLQKEPCAHIGAWEHGSRSWLPSWMEGHCIFERGIGYTCLVLCCIQSS